MVSFQRLHSGGGEELLVVNCHPLESFAGRNIMFILMISSSLLWEPNDFGGSFLYVWLLALTFFSFVLVCSSMLDLNFVYMVSFTFIRYYFIVLFVVPKMSFVELQVCISSGDNRRVVYSHRVSSAKLVPCPLPSCDSTPVPHPASPLLKACYWTRLLFPKASVCYWTRPVFRTLHNSVGVANILICAE